ncbi:hypothetical protein [Cryptosporangium sp. NPDC051539]|uniref:hypothetical protein n=1 Tax=Cryptosporangium sp. NPDC051539 TaxID=3363962 RepID=UPI003788BE2E
MSVIAAATVTVLGSACAAGTLWWAGRAERASAEPVPWWEQTSWWPSLSDSEREWVLRNLADADRE